MNKLVATGAAIGVMAAGVGTAVALDNTGSQAADPVPTVTVTVPPEDPACDLEPIVEHLNSSLCSVAGVIQFGWLSNVVNATQFQNWKRDNPGEYDKLVEYMANPQATGNEAPRLATFFGSALTQVVQAYKYAEGPNALTFPSPYIKPSKGDRKPPTPPDGLAIEGQSKS
jgi:hypothetical protein